LIGSSPESRPDRPTGITPGVPADEEGVLEPNPDRRNYDPPRTVRVLHDDGCWYRGAQFEWVRWPTGQWRAGIRYTTSPGETYLRSVPAERLIAQVDPASTEVSPGALS
jgi:hypothetical protein